MKKIFLILIAAFTFAACSDENLDPIQVKNIKKGSYLTLRGATFAFLLDNGYSGDIVNSKASSQKVVFDSEFLALDLTTLAKVDVYANELEKGKGRKLLGSYPGTNWVVKEGSKYPTANISIPYSEVLSKSGYTATQAQAIIDKNAANEAPTFLGISIDITLKDGTLVPASTIVNSGLYESLTFFPAHNQLFLLQ